MEKNHKYEFIADYRGDLSAIGFGDQLQLDYCPADGNLRVSVFRDGHWQDEAGISLSKLFAEE